MCFGHSMGITAEVASNDSRFADIGSLDRLHRGGIKLSICLKGMIFSLLYLDFKSQ